MPRPRSYGKGSTQLKLVLPAKVRETLDELFWLKRPESVNAMCVTMILDAIRAAGFDPYGGREQFRRSERYPEPEPPLLRVAETTSAPRHKGKVAAGARGGRRG